MEIFHHSMRCGTKDHQILECNYNQCDSVSYTVIIIDVNITHFTGILELEETHISITLIKIWFLK